MSSLGDKIFKGVAWSAIERLSIQGVQFLIQLGLLNILTPKEYGTVAILYVFISISFVFIDSGFTKALVQKKNRTEDDKSTVFFFNIALGVFFYCLLYGASSLVADFYEMPELKELLRVLAIVLITNSLFAVPMTLYTISMDFKSLAKINLIATITSGIIAYSMALQGYGVWSLVGLTLSRSIIVSILTWYFIKWKPRLVFSFDSFRNLFSFGSKLLVSSLLNVGVNKSYELVIPKMSTTEDLGFYKSGTQFTDVVFGIINSLFERVLLPGLTDVQDQIEKLVGHTRSIIKTAALLVIPLFLFLFVISEPLIIFLIGEKWEAAIPIMRLFCLARFITIISGINVNILYVLGRSDLTLKQQYLKLSIRAILLLAAVKFGIFYIALAELLSTTIHFFINTYYPGKIMRYGAMKQIKDMSRIIISSLLMSLIVYLILLPLTSNLMKLIIASIVALPIYLLLIRLFKVEEFKILLEKSKRFVRK